jgi:hypothetical protein
VLPQAEAALEASRERDQQELTSDFDTNKRVYEECHPAAVLSPIPHGGLHCSFCFWQHFYLGISTTLILQRFCWLMINAVIAVKPMVQMVLTLLIRKETDEHLHNIRGGSCFLTLASKFIRLSHWVVLYH